MLSLSHSAMSLLVRGYAALYKMEASRVFSIMEFGVRQKRGGAYPFAFLRNFLVLSREFGVVSSITYSRPSQQSAGRSVTYCCRVQPSQVLAVQDPVFESDAESKECCGQSIARDVQASIKTGQWKGHGCLGGREDDGGQDDNYPTSASELLLLPQLTLAGPYSVILYRPPSVQILKMM